MGYVFSLQERLEKSIPSPDDYKRADELLKDGLEMLVEKGDLVGVVVNGSTQDGPADVGSDIDVVVLYKEVAALSDLQRLSKVIANRTKVPVEFVPVQLDRAQRGKHTIDSQYAAYLDRFCRDSIIGESPVRYLAPAPSWSDPRTEVYDELGAKINRMSKDWANTRDFDQAHCHALERVSRQPIMAALDVIRINGEFPVRSDGRPMSKVDICAVYASDYEYGTEELLTVLDARVHYRSILQNVYDHPVSVYKKALERLDGAKPAALSFLMTVQDMFAKEAQHSEQS